MEELQKLYDSLSREGYYTKSFEDFQEQYADPAYRDKVFGVVTRDGLYTKSREEFDTKYSPVKKKDDSGVSPSVSQAPSGKSESFAQSYLLDNPDLIASGLAPTTNPAKGFMKAFLNPEFMGKLTSIPIIGDAIDEAYRGVIEANASRKEINELTPLAFEGSIFDTKEPASEKDIQEFIEAGQYTSEIQEKHGPSPALQKYYDTYASYDADVAAAKARGDFALAGGLRVTSLLHGMIRSPEAIPGLLVNSYGVLTNKMALATGGTVLGGAAGVGAIATAPAGGIGAVPAALASLPAAFAAAGGVTETLSFMSEQIWEATGKERKDVTTEDIQKIVSDEEFMDRIRIKGSLKGVSIVGIEYFGGRAVRKIGAAATKANRKLTLGEVAAAGGIESGSGFGGEVVGQIASGQDVDLAEAGLESFIPASRTPLNLVAGGIAAKMNLPESAKTKKYIVNDQEVTQDAFRKIIENADPEDLRDSGVKFEVQNDDAFWGEMSERLNQEPNEEADVATPEAETTQEDVSEEAQPQEQTLSDEVSQALESIDSEIEQAQAEVDEAAERAGIDAESPQAQEAATQKVATLKARKKEALRLIGEVGQAQEQTSDAEATAATEAAEFGDLNEAAAKQAELEGDLRDLLGVKAEPETVAIPDEQGKPTEVTIEDDTQQQPVQAEPTQEEQLVDDFEEFDLNDDVGGKLLESETVDTTIAEEVRTLQGSLKSDTMQEGKVVFHKTQESIGNVDEQTRAEAGPIDGYMAPDGTIHLGPKATRNTVREEFAHKAFVNAIGQDSKTRAATFDSLISLAKKNKAAEAILRERLQNYGDIDASEMSVDQMAKAAREQGKDTAMLEEEAIMGLMIDYANDPSKYKSQKNWFIKAAQKVLDTMGLGGTIKNENDVIALGKKLERATRGKQVDIQGDQTQASGRMAKAQWPKEGARVRYKGHEYVIRTGGVAQGEYGRPKTAGPFNSYDHFANWYRGMAGTNADGSYVYPDRVTEMRVDIDGQEYILPQPKERPTGKAKRRYSTYQERQTEKKLELGNQVDAIRKKASEVQKDAGDAWRSNPNYSNTNFFDFAPAIDKILRDAPVRKSLGLERQLAEAKLEAAEIQLENINLFNELEITEEEMQDMLGRGNTISTAKYPELFNLSEREHSLLAEQNPEEQESARSTGRFAKAPSEVVSQKPTKKQLKAMEGRPNSVMGTLKGLIKGLVNPIYVAMAYDSSMIANKSGVAETKPDVIFSHRKVSHAQATKEKIQAAIRADNTAPDRNRKILITYFTQGKEYLHGNPEIFEQSWRQIMEAAESDPVASKQIRQAVEDVLDFSKGGSSKQKTDLLNNVFLRLKSHPAVIVGEGKDALQRTAAKLHKNGVMKIKEKGLKLSIPDNNNLLAVFETLSNIRGGEVQIVNEFSFSKRNDFMKTLLLNIEARKNRSRSRALKSIPSLSLSRAQFLDAELATAKSGHAVAAKVIPAVSVNDVLVRENPESAFPFEVYIKGFEQDLTYLQEWPNLSEIDPEFQPEESAQAVRSSIRGRLDSGMAGRFSKANPMTTVEHDGKSFDVRSKSRVQEVTDNFLRKMANKYREIELIQADVEKSKGRPVDESQDFKMAEELMYGKAATALEKLDERVSDITSIMKDNGITEQDITDYLYALHAPERNALLLEREGVDNGSGISDLEAQEIIDEIAKSGKLKAFEEAGQKIQDIAQDTRNTMRKLGLETDARIDAFEDMFKNYVPLAGIAIDESGENVGTYPSGSTGFHVSGSRIKKAEGRKTPAINLFAQTVHMNAATHVRGQKNEVMKSLYNLIKENSNKDVWSVFDPEKKGEKRSIGNLDVVGVRVDGKQMAMQFADPSHAQSLRDMGVSKTNTFLKVMRGLSGWLRRSYTTLRPEFAINNFVRDIGSAVFNASAETEIEGGVLNGQKVVKDMMKMVPSSLSAFLKDSVGKDSDPLIKKYFEEFKEDGGRTGWSHVKSIQEIQEGIVSDTSDPKSGVKGVAQKLFGKISDTAEFVEGVNEAFENSVRMAAYVAARKNGVSRSKSAQFAKNVTVNFNKQGEYGQVLNAVYLFFNAGVQGTARFARSMGTLKPKQKADGTTRKGRERITTPQKLAGGMVLFNSMLTMLNIALSDRDEDDELFYNKIPDYVKERAMVIMVDGENYIKVPMPYGYNVFANMGQSMTEVAMGHRKPWSGVTFMTNSILTSFSPVSFGQSKDLITSISKGAVPTPFKPIVDVLANETYFGGKVHADQSPFGAPKPESELAFRSPESVQSFFRWMNEATGGSSEVSGSVDFNPDKMWYLFEYAIGGVGRDITRGVEAARKVAAKTVDPSIDVEFNDIAMMRALYGEPSKYYDFELYADRRDGIVQLSREYKKLSRAQRNSKGDRYDGLRKLDRQLKKSERELKKLRAIKREARREKDYTLRTSKLQKLFEEERKVIMEFNRVYNNIKGK